MERKKIIYLMQRDNWQQDNNLNYILLSHLKKTGYEVRWEDPAGNLLYKVRSFENRHKHFPDFLKKIDLRAVQFLYGVFHWDYFSFLSDRTDMSIELRAKRLGEALLKLGKDREIFILSRSSGCRISSLIADEFNIRHLICLSYPFLNRNEGDNPDRYRHLAKLRTPMLIFQGDHDQYGGLEVKEKYTFSSAIDLQFVHADHNFEIDDQDWHKVLGEIDRVLNIAL